MIQHTITFKHWKTEEVLTETGVIPQNLNNEASDRIILKTDSGEFIDIIKKTIIKMEINGNGTPNKITVGCRSC
jgi:hypothetical protein